MHRPIILISVGPLYLDPVLHNPQCFGLSSGTGGQFFASVESAVRRTRNNPAEECRPRLKVQPGRRMLTSVEGTSRSMDVDVAGRYILADGC